jgi:hypothetical protein
VEDQTPTTALAAVAEATGSPFEVTCASGTWRAIVWTL